MKPPRRSWPATLGLAALLLRPWATLAEEGPVTLHQAVSLAFTHEETVGIAARNVEEARLQRRKALLSVSPNLALSAGWGYSNLQPTPGADLAKGGLYSYTLSLNQPFYTGGRATSAMRSADKVIRINDHAYRLTREEVFLLATRAFYDVLAAQKLVEAERQGVRSAGDFMNLAKARFDLGDATRTSLLKAQFELSRRENELVQAQNGLAVARETLKKTIGRDFAEAVDEQIEVDMPVTGDLAGLVAKAVARRREILVAREAVGLAEEGIVSARGRFLPVLYANAYYSQGNSSLPPDGMENWGVSLNLDLPLFDRGQSIGDLALAKVALERSRLELAQAEKGVKLEVEADYYRLAGLKSGVASLRKQVELAEENSRGVRKQYEVGLATDLEMNTALTDLLSARVQLIRSEYDLLLAGLVLQKAMGDLPLPE